MAKRNKLTPLMVAQWWGMEYGNGRTANINVYWNVTRGKGGRLGVNRRPGIYEFYWDGRIVTRQEWNKQYATLDDPYPLFPTGDVRVCIDAKWTLMPPFPVWELRDGQYFDYWSLDGDIVIRQGLHDHRRSKPLAKYAMPVSLEAEI